jgi:phospholipid/cholesterol/gamma-HCH transport system substrate-binding protein
MDERVVQFRVGAVVLTGVIVAGILVALFGSIPNITAPSATVYITFPQAMGVSRDTPIRKYGILVGRVKEVEFAPDSGVLVTAEIYQPNKVSTNEVCEVHNGLLGGDAVIQFMGRNDKLPHEALKDGDRLIGIAAMDPAQAIASLQTTMAGAVSSVTNTSDEIGRLASRVNDLLSNNDEQIARVGNKAEATLDRLYSISDKQAMLDLPDVIRDTRGAVQGFKTTLETADRNFQNLEGLTKPLGQRGAQLVENIDRTTLKLNDVLTEMQTFSRALNNPNGSLGKMINDPAMYQRVEATVKNVEQLTRELKPVIRNAQEFSDRIARHPELLGVRGAIKPSSGIK